MVGLILCFIAFVFIVRNLRFIICCTIALLLAGVILGPAAHAEEYCHVEGCHDTDADLRQYYVQAEHMCETIGSDGACYLRDAIVNKLRRLGFHWNGETWQRAKGSTLYYVPNIDLADDRCAAGHTLACSSRDDAIARMKANGYRQIPFTRAWTK